MLVTMEQRNQYLTPQGTQYLTQYRTPYAPAQQAPRHRAPLARTTGLLVVVATSGVAGAAALSHAHAIAMADTGSTEGLLLASAWWASAALLAWLVASTLAAGAARASGAWRAASWFDAATLPVVRRLLDRVLAVSIATSALVPLAASAAGAAPVRPTRVEHVAAASPSVRRHALPAVRRHALPRVRRHALPAVRRHAVPAVRRHAVPRQPPPASAPAAPPIVRGATTTTSVAAPTTAPPTTAPPTTAAAPTPTTAPVAPAPSPAARSPRGSAVDGVHVVVRDDNLWTIAATELARHGAARDEATTARYWRRVVERNRARLRSGDANIIFPGEVIWLPPVDLAG